MTGYSYTTSTRIMNTSKKTIGKSNRRSKTSGKRRGRPVGKSVKKRTPAGCGIEVDRCCRYQLKMPQAELTTSPHADFWSIRNGKVYQIDSVTANHIGMTCFSAYRQRPIKIMLSPEQFTQFTEAGKLVKQPLASPLSR